MQEIKEKSEDKLENLEMLIDSVEIQFEIEKDIIANLSNISSYINLYLDDINWAGFYIMKKGELVLGPFQGKAACTRIKVGNGVCGSAALNRRIYRVDNVLEFPGHIACDGDSRSEIVVPIIVDNEVFGVLDIDSPSFNRFTQLEEDALEKVVSIIQKNI